MPVYIFDTDSFSLALDDVEPISSRIAATPISVLFTSVITVDESLSGWHALVRRARSPFHLEFAYGELIRAVKFFGSLQLLNYTQAAAARFDSLLRAKLNVKKNDLRIAAIALEFGAIVVTRNVRDFNRIPHLLVEDWMVP